MNCLRFSELIRNYVVIVFLINGFLMLVEHAYDRLYMLDAVGQEMVNEPV